MDTFHYIRLAILCNVGVRFRYASPGYFMFRCLVYLFVKFVKCHHLC